jgi:hypothetical protein
MGSGCASLKEAWYGLAGTSTKVLEEGRKNAIKQEFDCDYPTCRTKVMAVLDEMMAYIYRKDEAKKMIAIYLSKQDTTVVGIFFKELENNKTKIEISSPSTYARELIAAKIFPVLKEQCSPKQETAQGEVKVETLPVQTTIEPEESREQTPDSKE